jgi:Phospholipase_D-nuclease N-terminal
MAQNKKRWSDLTRAQQVAICVGGAVELVLTAYALRDLARRPSQQVRGPKAAWVLGFSVQPVGPLAYLTVGRR